MDLNERIAKTFGVGVDGSSAKTGEPIVICTCPEEHNRKGPRHYAYYLAGVGTKSVHVFRVEVKPHITRACANKSGGVTDLYGEKLGFLSLTTVAEVEEALKLVAERGAKERAILEAAAIEKQRKALEATAITTREVIRNVLDTERAADARPRKSAG